MVVDAFLLMYRLLVVVDARTQHRLVDQLFLVPRPVRLSEKSDELLRKILRAVPEGSRDELKEIVEEDFVGRRNYQ